MNDTKPIAERTTGSKPMRRPRENRELKVVVELVAVDGEEGSTLHEIQAQVVSEILMSLARSRSRQPHPCR